MPRFRDDVEPQRRRLGHDRRMDSEGISTLVAAGVAVIGIPTALAVGRWQLRGALRAADATTRAGIAQAEASYRAALDAVRATATESQAQWLRGVRREAYAAFLLACSEVVETSAQLGIDGTRGKIQPDQRDARRAELAAMVSRLENCVMIVALEGPEDISVRAETMAAAAKGAARECEYRFKLHAAWSDFEGESPHSDDGTNAYYQALMYLQVVLDRSEGDPRQAEPSTLPSEVQDALEEVFAARDEIGRAHV